MELELMHQKLDSFGIYLKNSSLNQTFLDLSDKNLMEVIEECIKVKEKSHPTYRSHCSGIIYNLNLLQQQYDIILKPIQITDVFWSHFIKFCQDRGLRSSTINTMCQQLHAILHWAIKYNAQVSPSYDDFVAPKVKSQEIALTADEISRIAYFDVDLFYKDRRADFIDTMKRMRDMFVLSCNLFQRYSDMVRIEPSCFDKNIFKITQQKTENTAIVNIDKYSIDPKTTYRILEQYNYEAPYKGAIGNYNYYLHLLMKDIGFVESVRIENKINGEMVIENIPKYKLISSHTARRTAITINVLRGHNIHSIKKCSGHTDLRVFDNYIRDE